MEIKKPKTVIQLCGENWLDGEISKLTKRTQDDGIVEFYVASEGFYRLHIDNTTINYSSMFIYEPLRNHFKLNDDEINSVVENCLHKLGYTDRQAIGFKNILSRYRVHI